MYYLPSFAQQPDAEDQRGAEGGPEAEGGQFAQAQQTWLGAARLGEGQARRQKCQSNQVITKHKHFTVLLDQCLHVKTLHAVCLINKRHPKMSPRSVS